MFWVGMALAAVGTVMQAEAARDNAKNQADATAAAGLNDAYEGYLNQALREIEADQVMDEGIQLANRVRREALVLRSQQMVAHAASGVLIGEGSAQIAQEHIETLASADTLALMYSTVNRAHALTTQGDFAAKAGENRQRARSTEAGNLYAQGENLYTAGMIQAAGQIASAVASSGVGSGGASQGAAGGSGLRAGGGTGLRYPGGGTGFTGSFAR